MASDSALKEQKVENPANNFENPGAVVKDKDLSLKEKKTALNTWEQDARQLLAASDEGMPGRDEGLIRDGPHHLGQAVRAKVKLGEKPTGKPSK
jgi:hypothetical protein